MLTCGLREPDSISDQTRLLWKIKSTYNPTCTSIPAREQTANHSTDGSEQLPSVPLVRPSTILCGVCLTLCRSPRKPTNLFKGHVPFSFFQHPPLPSSSMSRYSPYNIPGASDIYHQTDRLDDLCSQSGSDEGSAYVEAMLGDMVKVDTDVDGMFLPRSLSYAAPLIPFADDCSSGSLTSQTLNVDGTPKRPMNAFMIFARRRRPQVSSENQSMRTGEISKILSREWNAMPPVNLLITSILGII